MNQRLSGWRGRTVVQAAAKAAAVALPLTAQKAPVLASAVAVTGLLAQEFWQIRIARPEQFYFAN